MIPEWSANRKLSERRPVRQSSQVVKYRDYTSDLIGLPGISAVLRFQLSPTGVEDIERLLSCIQRGLRSH
jgi:hypothetical protein